MKVLVIGASGLVGSALLRTAPDAWEVLGTTHRQPRPDLLPLDATNPSEVVSLVEQGFDWVLLPAANPNVDGCERDPTATRQINVDAVEFIAKSCAKTGAGLGYFSSDYVFDGNAGPYTENDPPNPINEYGRQKLEAEQILRPLDKHLIIRTTGVFGVERLQKNFAYRVIQTLKRGETLKVPLDQMGNPTLADDLARMVWALCGRQQGLFHVAGKDWISRLGFAQHICEVFELDAGLLEGISTSVLGQVAARPLKGGLVSTKAETAIPHPMHTVKSALLAFKQGLGHADQA